jgi:hypothetical protein
LITDLTAASHTKGGNDLKAKLTALEQETRRVASRYDIEWNQVIADLTERISITRRYCDELGGSMQHSAAGWETNAWETWKPFTTDHGTGNPTLAFGQVALASPPSSPAFRGLDFGFRVPAMMSLASGRGLMIKAPGSLKEEAAELLRSMMLRMLATLPPGMVRFTFFDPLGLGQNVAAFIPLGLHDERLITSRAWSEPQKIDEELSKITDHLTDVIQSRLRNDHRNIEEYNDRSPALREPYRVVVAMDFPVNYRTDAARRLVSIAQNGARCGVYPLILVDEDLSEKHVPHGFNLQSLEQFVEVIEWKNESWIWRGYEDWRLAPDRLDVSQQKHLIDRIVNDVGSLAKDMMAVKVPFSQVLEKEGLLPEKYWTGSTRDGISVPLGPLNVTQSMHFKLGESAHHGIIIGRTGSGKSKLMDVIITTLALKYSPDEMQFYLVDLKSGVGFKPYASMGLPHARVIAIDSEREYALSVLKSLEKQMDDRHVTFRGAGRENLTEYRKQHPEEVLPRILLVVDEFQNLFLEEDAIAAQAKTILERLTREGRSAGIHILLGSQSLAGKASNLPSAALGQIGIRMALMCNASDAQAIMAHDNSEARLLSRPGEAIYNDHNGLVEGNKRFQVALLEDEEQRHYLNEIKELKRQRQLDPDQMVFEGNAMASLENCREFQSLVESGATNGNVRRVEAWLGEPIAIAPPVAVRLSRQSGSNLLVVASQEKEGVGMLTSALLSLAARRDELDPKFHILNFTNVEEEWHEFVQMAGDLLPYETALGGRTQLAQMMAGLAEECSRRMSTPEELRPREYLFAFGLQRAKDLRVEDGFKASTFGVAEKVITPAENFATILKEGPEVGIHVLAWCDMAANVKRTLGRNLINEFNYRAAGRMSQDDSQFIIESTAAAKIDREFRAVFYDEDRPGHLEKFRPFAIPNDRIWLKQVAKMMAGEAAAGTGA